MTNVESTLTNAGIDLATVPEEQKEVLLGLSEQEASIFASVKERMDAAADDMVTAHGPRDTTTIGGTFW